MIDRFSVVFVTTLDPKKKTLLDLGLNPAPLVLQATGLTFQRHFSSFSRTGSDLGRELSTIAIAKSRKTYSSDQMQKCSWLEKLIFFSLQEEGNLILARLKNERIFYIFTAALKIFLRSFRTQSASGEKFVRSEWSLCYILLRLNGLWQTIYSDCLENIKEKPRFWQLH